MSAYGNDPELRAILGPRLAQLTAAIERCDGDTAMKVVEQVRTDGHPIIADQLLERILDDGIREFVEQVTQ